MTVNEAIMGVRDSGQKVFVASAKLSETECAYLNAQHEYYESRKAHFKACDDLEIAINGKRLKRDYE